MTSEELFVRAVEAYMREAIAGAPAAAPASRLLDAGGKRLRARLVWWSAAATVDAPCDPHDTKLVRAAAAIELAHLGSLVHDDIVDGAETRRGVVTVHRADGLRAAADAGAALAYLATALIAPLGYRVRCVLRRALLATCRGQIHELAIPFIAVSPRVRLAIMQEKTGALFELAAALGALLVGADRRADAAVRRFARRFGVAFQIADDVFDLTGDPAELGRANGADLRDGVLTLPVLLADDPNRRIPGLLAELRRSADSAAVAACTAAIVGGGGTTAASGVASWWLERAIAALQALPPRDARDRLVALARRSVARGLRVGSGASRVLEWCPKPAVPGTRALIPSANVDGEHGVGLPSRLVHILEWFHPGLSLMVAADARDPAIAARRRILGAGLRADGIRSADAATALEAIGLAHALADRTALRTDPVRGLAVIDSLHCAAITLLALCPSAEEHEHLAIRAHGILRPPCRPSELPDAPARPRRTVTAVQLSA